MEKEYTTECKNHMITDQSGLNEKLRKECLDTYIKDGKGAFKPLVGLCCVFWLMTSSILEILCNSGASE